jgi:molybdate transport system substrate-binding protein
MEVTMGFYFRACAFSAVLIALTTGSTMAQQLTIYSGGAVKSGLEAAAAAYEKEKGTKIRIEFQPMGPLTKALSEGAKADIAIVTEDVWADTESKKLVDSSTKTEIGRVAIGVAVHESAPTPDISTPEALKAALLKAKSVVYIDPQRGTSGRHFAGVLQQLGIADEVNAKTKFGSGGYVVEPVGKGEIELGVHQITEILPVKGVKLVGPLPAALQKETVYVGALTPKAENRAEATSFLAFLRMPETRKIFAEKGFNEK